MSRGSAALAAVVEEIERAFKRTSRTEQDWMGNDREVAMFQPDEIPTWADILLVIREATDSVTNDEYSDYMGEDM